MIWQIWRYFSCSLQVNFFPWERVCFRKFSQWHDAACYHLDMFFVFFTCCCYFSCLSRWHEADKIWMLPGNDSNSWVVCHSFFEDCSDTFFSNLNPNGLFWRIYIYVFHQWCAVLRFVLLHLPVRLKMEGYKRLYGTCGSRLRKAGYSGGVHWGSGRSFKCCWLSEKIITAG